LTVHADAIIRHGREETFAAKLISGLLKKSETFRALGDQASLVYRSREARLVVRARL